MTTTWPRLPMAETSAFVQRIRNADVPAPTTRTNEQIYAEVGARVTESAIRRLHTEMAAAAARHGFPDTPPASVRNFDREAAGVLAKAMDLAWSEAANRDMWSFVALVVLPDVTAWRWSGQEGLNEERWVGRDLTRHTWARLWWQAATFAGHEDVLDTLLESELNQFFERREIGGRPALVVALARAAVAAADLGTVPRRDLIRDVTKRARRALAYIDPESLTAQETAALAEQLTAESVAQLQPMPAPVRRGATRMP